MASNNAVIAYYKYIEVHSQSAKWRKATLLLYATLHLIKKLQTQPKPKEHSKTICLSNW